jgi:hypothetical protein
MIASKGQQFWLPALAIKLNLDIELQFGSPTSE